MKDCDVYKLLTFLDSKVNDEELVINATKINELSRRLREDGIKCDFSLSALEYAENEYPNLIEVSYTSIIIKRKDIKISRIINHNKNDYVLKKIEYLWENLKES